MNLLRVLLRDVLRPRPGPPEEAIHPAAQRGVPAVLVGHGSGSDHVDERQCLRPSELESSALTGLSWRALSEKPCSAPG